MPYPKIKAVTDMRTGLRHPERNARGHFVSPRWAAERISKSDEILSGNKSPDVHCPERGRLIPASQYALERLDNMSSPRSFDVFLGGKHIDTVFYSRDTNITAEEVKRDLIDHDGYHPTITVREDK